MTTNENTTYNGWTNYETWAVGLWLDNDQGSQEMVQDMARQAMRGGYSSSRSAEGLLADALKDMIQEEAPEIGNNLYSDLLTAAIGSVDWYDLAEHYLGDLEPEPDDDSADDETESA